ncbi:TetR family transcriptional regulator, partial [Mycobacterium sp. ITM-2017-0098]
MGKRQETRDRIERQIIDLGRTHLVTHGAAGLSLRAIARELGMVSSAVYRYVGSRDELLTLLLVDAYTELAEAVERARDAAA